MARNFEDQLVATEGRPTGFDYLRLTLAVLVVAWHTVLVLGGRAAETPYFTGQLRPLILSLLPAFFSLSGFLVAGSLERNDLPSFLTLRALRIFPALSVAVAVSAFIIGPLMTTDTLRVYFTDPNLLRFLLSAAGWIYYTLPGLFQDLPVGMTVHAQLWTVPYELAAYLIIAALALLGVHRRPLLFFGLVLGLMLGSDLLGVALPKYGIVLDSKLPGLALVLAFLFGVSLYLLRRTVPFSRGLFAAAILASWATASFAQTTYLCVLPMAYATIYLGLQNPRKVFLVRGADYSYGIYVYGFVLQQIVCAVFPSLRVWWFHLPVSVALAAACASLSWRFVERPALDGKQAVLAMVARVTALRARFGSATLAKVTP